ncbi:MAG: TetR family transcriptional regulator C-terminal domain-containing protein [Steroidobacteraceae bacterium]
MSARAQKPRYKRRVASERRDSLVEAAIESLKHHGHEGLSVRRIAAEAGVSIGLINHHFPNKDTLVAESYRTFSQRLTDSFEAAVEAAGADPRARLRAFFRAVFSRPNLDPQVLTVWVVFWGLLQVSPEMRAVHDEEGRGYGDLLGKLLKDFAKESGRLRFDVRLATIGLTALLDGLWLEWCLDPQNFRPAEAAALCEVWIDKLTRA